MLCRGWIVRGVEGGKRSRASNLPFSSRAKSCRIVQARRKRLQPCWGRLRGGKQIERVEYRRLGRDLQVPHYIRAIISHHPLRHHDKHTLFSLSHFSSRLFFPCWITGLANSNDSYRFKSPFSSKIPKYCRIGDNVPGALGAFLNCSIVACVLKIPRGELAAILAASAH